MLSLARDKISDTVMLEDLAYFNRGSIRIVWFSAKWKLFNNWFLFPLLCCDFSRLLGTKNNV